MSSARDQAARSEAAEWHARLQSRAVSNAELESFYAWRGDPVNAGAFDEVERVWTRLAELAGEPEVENALASLLGRNARPGGVLGALRLPTRWLAAVAASLVVCIGVAAFLLVDQPLRYRTGVGERLVVVLEDGSRVTLNTSSRLSVRLSSASRDLVLEEGQALFHVARDPDRPFRVTSRGVSVTALGTLFEVRGEGSATRVLLLEGRISVRPSRGGSPARLVKPGDVLLAVADRPRIGRMDPGVATSWINGKIDLRDVPLAQAIQEVNRYSERRIVLDDPAQAGTRVSGSFATGDPEAFSAAVTALLPLRQRVEQDGTLHLAER
jgi:transmembrane sensor